MSSRYLAARAFKTSRRSAGDVTVSAATWANVDTGMDVTLAAGVGDMLAVSVSGLWSNSARVGYLDVVTVGGSSPTTLGSGVAESGTFEGVMAWWGAPSAYSSTGGLIVAPVALAAGDIVSGYVQLRLRARLDAAGSKVLYANAAEHLVMTAWNLGPADPN